MRMVDDSSVRGDDEQSAMVTVFATSDLAAMLSARVALDGEAIPYVISGEVVQDLVGLGRGVGFTDPVTLRVHSGDAVRAREALAGIR
jgi:hypothetical protein